MSRLKAVWRELPFFCSLPALLWQALFLLIPLSIVVGMSMRDPGAATWWQSFTLKQYQTVLQSPFLRILWRSLWMALITAVTCLVVAYPVAYFLAIKVSDRWKYVLLFLLTLPFWTNFLVQIYAWFFLLERHGLINMLLLKLHIIREPLMLVNSLLSVFILMVYCYLPFMIMPLYTSLTKINHVLLEASADLGATRWQTFTRITIPLSFPGIKTGLLLVMVPAFGELAIPVIMSGNKYMFVGSLIYYLFLVVRNNPLGAAVTLTAGIILMVVAFAIQRILGSVYEAQEEDNA